MSYTPNAARTDRGNSWSTAQLTSALGSIDSGSTAKPWRDIYLSPNAGSNYYKITSASLTGNRTLTLPDSDSTAVIGTTATANQFLTHITTGGVQTKAQPASSDLSDSSNIALRNSTNSWSADQVPSSASGGIDLGSSTFPWWRLFLNDNGGTYYTLFQVQTLSNNRIVTLPNADSTTVQPDTGASNNFLTAISSTGVISKAQPSFTNISGTATIAQGGTNNGSLGVSALGIYVGDGSKIVQVTGTANQQFRVNAGGTAIEAFTPSAGSSSWTIVTVNSTPYTITESSMTMFLADTSSDTFTLPTASGSGKVFKFARKGGTTGTKTISRAGSDVIYNNATSDTSITFTKGVIEIIDVESGVWMVT